MDIASQVARQANPQSLMVSGSERRPAFQPVLVCSGPGQWRFGLVSEWIRVPGHPWIARILSGPADTPNYYAFYDVLGDGAIVPLSLDATVPVPLMRPADRPPAQ